MVNCKNLTFEECELFILRQSVDKIDKTTVIKMSLNKNIFRIKN